MTLEHFDIDSPVGRLRLIANNGGVAAILWANDMAAEEFAASVPHKDNAVLWQTAAQLHEYFSGQRVTFDVPLNPKGTAFQCRVWAALRDIPFGQTRSYKQIAQAVGKPNAAQAVGGANARNPIPIITPCHRVIGKDGRMVGFSGGMDTKVHLLKIEGAI